MHSAAEINIGAHFNVRGFSILNMVEELAACSLASALEMHLAEDAKSACTCAARNMLQIYFKKIRLKYIFLYTVRNKVFTV